MLSPISNKSPHEAWHFSVQAMSTEFINLEILSYVYAQILSVDSFILSRFIDAYDIFYSESEHKYGVPGRNVGVCAHDLFDSIMTGYKQAFAEEENTESEYKDSLVGLCVIWAIIRMSTYVDVDKDNLSPVIEVLGENKIISITEIAKYLIESDDFDLARVAFCVKSRNLFFVEEDKETLSLIFGNGREGRLRHLGSFDRRPRIKWP